MKRMKSTFIRLPFFSLLSIFSLLTVLSCKKNNQVPVQAATSAAPKVASASATIGNTFNYSYDNV